MEEDRILHLYGNIESSTVYPIFQSIIYINNIDDQQPDNERKPIHLFINSGGGIIYDCLTLVSAIESSKTPIYTYTHGYVMSAGLTVFVAGHKRFAGKYSTFMIHQPTEPLGEDKYFVLMNRLDETKRLMDIRTKFITSKTKLTLEQFEAHQYLDWFMDAEEAKYHGIVHEII
jgi:ATP-dependent Clp protease protease subunit